MKKTLVRVAGSLCIALLLGLSIVGCEQVASNLGSLSVSPAQATLTPGSNIVQFTAGVDTNDALSLPIKWTLSDPSLGQIVQSYADTAIYKGYENKNGNNILTATDQRGNQGFATIQQSSTLSVTASATSITLSSSNTMVTVTVSGGTPPFQWSVSDGSIGFVSQPATGSSVSYVATAAGTQVIDVSDAEGATGNATISQQ